MTIDGVRQIVLMSAVGAAGVAPSDEDPGEGERRFRRERERGAGRTGTVELDVLQIGEPEQAPRQYGSVPPLVEICHLAPEPESAPAKLRTYTCLAPVSFTGCTAPPPEGT